MNTYLVIDIGTSSTRGILYDGEVNKLDVHQVQTSPIYNGDIVEKDAKDFDIALDQIMNYMANYLKETKNILVSIILTAQRSSLICLDDNHEPLIPIIMWQDKRSHQVVDTLKEYNDQVMDLSGSPLNPVYLAPKIKYVEEHLPNTAMQTKKYLTIADYVRFRITGEFKTDYTYGSRTSLMNIKRKEWDLELLDIFSVDKEKLCELVPPGNTQSFVSEAFLDKYSLNNQVSFISAGGDQQCSAVGMGVLKEDDIAISLGTGGYIIQATDTVSNSKSYITNVYSIDSLYMKESILPTSSSALNWGQDNLYPNLSNEEFYSEIENILMNKKITETLHFPHFQGRGTPDWNSKAKAAFFNIDFSTNQQDLLLALVESIGFEIKNNLDAMMGTNLGQLEQVVIAGGLSKNKAICQMLSDILEIKVLRKADSEATAFGAYVVGILALYPEINPETIFEKTNDIENEMVFIPNKQKNNYYRKKLIEWNDLYSKLYA